MRYVLTKETLSFFYKGQTFCISSDHPYFNSVAEALTRGDDRALLALADPNAYLQNLSERLGVSSGVATLEERPLLAELGVKLIETGLNGLPISPYLALIEKTWQHFNEMVQEHIFRAVSQDKFALTYEGNLVAYTFSTSTFLDTQQNQFQLNPGSQFSITRGMDVSELKGGVRPLYVESTAYILERQSYITQGWLPIEVEVDPRLIMGAPRDLRSLTAIAGFSVQAVTVQELTKRVPLIFLVKKGEYITPAVPDAQTEALIQAGQIKRVEVACTG